MVQILRSFSIAFTVILYTGLMSVVAILASLTDHGGDRVHGVARAWARGVLFLSRIKVNVRGTTNIRSDESKIYMSNHLSNFDIPVLLAHLPIQFRWLAKTELFRIPVFGFALKRAGYIPIDRTNLRSAIASLKRAADIIRGGVSVLVFPEGTRSRDGRLRSFKKGGFVMAMESGVSITPVILRGTWEIMSKSGLRISPGDATLEVLPAIDASAFSGRKKEDLMDRVRDVMQDALKQGEERPEGC